MRAPSFLLGLFLVGMCSASCMDVSAPKGAIVAPGTQADLLCTEWQDVLDCGHVYAFRAQPRDNPLGYLEVCFLERTSGIELLVAQAAWGPAEKSWHERFGGVPICHWRCDGQPGCNAYGPDASCWGCP